MFNNLKWKLGFEVKYLKPRIIMYAVWKNFKTRVNIPLQQYLQFNLEYCKLCCHNKGVMSSNGTRKHDNTDLYQSLL